MNVNSMNVLFFKWLHCFIGVYVCKTQIQLASWFSLRS